jgi:succinoglycan biosynthesis transport protein ExoP
MTLDDLLLALRRHRLPAALVTLLLMGVTAAATLLPADRYAATTILIAKPAESGDVLSYSTAVQVLVPTLTAYVEGQANEDLVRGSQPTPIARADVELTAEAEPGVGLIYITASSTQRDAVEPWANASGFALRTRQADDIAGIRLEVLDEAVDPEEPAGPPRAAIALGGVVLSLLAGLVTALFLRALSARAELADVLHRRTGIPVIASLPRLKRGQRRELEPGQLACGETDPRVTEALQRIRVATDAVSPGVLAVTSLHPGEGKSSVTAALSWSLAAAGYAVLTVDADLRRPTQHERFGTPLQPGLSDAGRVPPHKLTRGTLEPSLQLLPAGVPAKHPLDVLDEALPPVLEQLRASTPMMLIDTPPLESVAETQRILLLAGHTLLVVSAPRANADEIEKAVSRLRATGVEVVGIVLNRVRGRQPGRKDAYYLAATPRPAGRVAPVATARDVAEPVRTTRK